MNGLTQTLRKLAFAASAAAGLLTSQLQAQDATGHGDALGFAPESQWINKKQHQFSQGGTEIRFNFGYLAVDSFEGSLEHFVLNDFAVLVAVHTDSDATDFNGDFGITPAFRGYFGVEEGYTRSAVVPFGEGFFMHYTGTDDDIVGADKEFNTNALGAGGGLKFVNTTGTFRLEAYAGIGWNLNEVEGQSGTVFRWGLSMGLGFGFGSQRNK